MIVDLYVFLVKRPIDKEAWPVAFLDPVHAQQHPYRASDVYPIKITAKEPINIPVKS